MNVPKLVIRKLALLPFPDSQFTLASVVSATLHQVRGSSTNQGVLIF